MGLGVCGLLPARVLSDAGDMNSHESTPSTNPASARVLIVDDDPAVRRVIRSLLEFLGHTTAEAQDGFAALTMLGTFEPQVVLLDMLMPEKDGIETLREIREFDPITPVIAMSGGSRIDAALCLRFASNLGAPLVLLKPFTADELGTAIDLALKNGEAARKAADPQAGLTG
jgi:CheY-like chemotaxis protein